MKRDYTTGVSDSVTLFIGTEIEHTPAYNMKTLFVVGVHDEQNLISIAVNNGCRHMYFGANQSFPKLAINDSEGWKPWEEMIKGCLDAGYWCTLDFDVEQVEALHESGLCEHRRFIPQISVKVPYLSLLNYNATIKIDDKDFDATNPGVWCVPLGAVTQKKYFTNWDSYTNDEIIL